MTSPTITHDREHHRFIMETEHGQAVLDYGKAGENTLNFYHTFVPPADREQGLAGAVVEAAMNYARENGLKVVAGCSYVRDWVRRNPDFKDLVG